MQGAEVNIRSCALACIDVNTDRPRTYVRGTYTLFYSRLVSYCIFWRGIDSKLFTGKIVERVNMAESESGQMTGAHWKEEEIRELLKLWSEEEIFRETNKNLEMLISY